MSWFYRDNASRAAELNTMAYMTWQRRSKNPVNKLEVRLENPQDKDSAFIVVRDGTASKPMKRTKEVQRYIRRFFNDLLYNGTDAPDDIFVDSLKAVTKRKV